MANKRNYEWPQASAWDGYFTQDKPGGPPSAWTLPWSLTASAMRVS